MSLFTINLYVQADNVQTLKLLADLLERSNTIMTTVAEINAKLDALKTAIAAERQEVLTDLQGFKDQIKALSDQIAAGTPATQADLDAIGASLDESIASTQAIITDADK